MPSRTNHPACPGHAAIYQLPSCWDTLCALAGHRGSVQVILGHEVKPHEWSNTTGTQLWPTFPRSAPPPSIKLDNMAYFIPVLPWLLQLFYFFPVHYFLTPPRKTVSEHKRRRTVTQQHHSSEEDMVKRSVTLLQRDANYDSPYAEAGQTSCDCSTKPPGRKKCEDQGQEEESKRNRRQKVPPAAPKAPWKKTHIYHTCMCPVAGQDPGAGQKSRGANPAHGTYRSWALGSPVHCAYKFICKAQLGALQTAISRKLLAESTVDLS